MRERDLSEMNAMELRDVIRRAHSMIERAKHVAGANYDPVDMCRQLTGFTEYELQAVIRRAATILRDFV